MPESITSNFAEDKNAETNAPIWLYEIDVVVGTLYYTEYPENVTFGGQVYTSVDIAHSEVEERLDGGVGGIIITVGDAYGIIQAYLEHDEYDSLREERIIVRQVFANHLVNAADCVVDEYWIDTIDVDAEASMVSFHTREKLDGMTISLPGRKYPRFICQFSYKKLGCWLMATGDSFEAPPGFVAGTPDTCSRKLDDCIRHNNNKRMGAFLGVPTSRVIRFV